MSAGWAHSRDLQVLPLVEAHAVIPGADVIDTQGPSAHVTLGIEVATRPPYRAGPVAHGYAWVQAQHLPA